ncbi:AT-rich interactive domain-containing protein 2 [Humulus lupulus]|uniref:AT-rich interactive domain-containing protein 2 n=1 Tax=Humulus lupulus TaxID=3486 RepID=UPI002B40BEF6|nr:AT-rich interactive domain-containing protein 2 [Humulus lupulus]
MAGWSMLANGSALDSVENIGAHQGNDFLCGEEGGGSTVAAAVVGNGSDDGGDGVGHEVRRLFDKVLAVFLKAISKKGVFRPVPAVVDYSKAPVDLLKLFWLVRDKGGFDSVSEKRLWAMVAKELGLGVGATAAVKLVYFKYLSELEKWLGDKRFKDQTSENGNFRLLSLELESEFRDLFSDRFDWEGSKDGRLDKLKFDSQNGGDCNERKLCLSDTIQCKRDHDEKVVIEDEKVVNEDHKDDDLDHKDHKDDDLDHKDDDDLILNFIVNMKEKASNKRKRESLSGLLNWLTEMAKHSGDPSIGIIAGPSKLMEHGEKELWVQAMRAREVLLQRRHLDSNNEESLLQKKLKMHPSMYEDNKAVNRPSSDRSRCSTRASSVVKSRSCPCCRPCSSSPTKLISPHKVELESEPKEEASVVDDLPVLVKEVYPSEDESIQKQVSVGPLFQANIPEWTGVVIESDSKWLGTRVWPLESGEVSMETTDTIGKGRPELCNCRLPGSVECVRFHIAEARMKLKRELGLVFYRWKFDRMGEEISLQWTTEEEKKFKDIVRSGMHFWEKKTRWLIRKTREQRVSYYFNVFLVQKRSYQNRVTPIKIDSDDDETEFGTIGDCFGNNAVNVSGSKLLPCILNRQCTDLD